MFIDDEFNSLIGYSIVAFCFNKRFPLHIHTIDTLCIYNALYSTSVMSHWGFFFTKLCSSLFISYNTNTPGFFFCQPILLEFIILVSGFLMNENEIITFQKAMKKFIVHIFNMGESLLLLDLKERVVYIISFFQLDTVPEFKQLKILTSSYR